MFNCPHQHTILRGVGATMRKVVDDRLTGIGHSMPSEGAFNKGRRREDGTGNTSQLPPRLFWQHLVDTKLASKT